jgi:hypothetical protein
MVMLGLILCLPSYFFSELEVFTSQEDVWFRKWQCLFYIAGSLVIRRKHKFCGQREPCLKFDFCHSCVTLFELPSSVQVSDSYKKYRSWRCDCLASTKPWVQTSHRKKKGSKIMVDLGHGSCCHQCLISPSLSIENYLIISGFGFTGRGSQRCYGEWNENPASPTSSCPHWSFTRRPSGARAGTEVWIWAGEAFIPLLTYVLNTWDLNSGPSSWPTPPALFFQDRVLQTTQAGFQVWSSWSLPPE